MSADKIVVDWNVVSGKLDWTVAVYATLTCIVLPIVHHLLHNYVVTPVAKRLLGWRDTKKTDEVSSGKARKLEKFQESGWKCFAYLCLAAASAYALCFETFWRDTREFWTECAHVPCEYRPTDAMLFAYALDMAYYSYAVPYAILFETKRKDFAATMSHHVVTVVLIGYSYALGFTKVGVVVLFLHDICDPALEAAKMASYAGSELWSNFFFVLFTVTWIVMRDVYYPFWVIYSVCVEAPAWFLRNVPDASPWTHLAPHWQLFAGMLIFLWVLHMYWTKVIVDIAVKALSSGAPSDVREDDDDDA